MIRKGDKMESILTGRLYQVKAIKDWAAVLESLDGSIQVLTEKGNLELFYKTVENKENGRILGFSSSPKPLRCPAYVIVGFL
jgi:hypothetical protein